MGKRKKTCSNNSQEQDVLKNLVMFIDEDGAINNAPLYMAIQDLIAGRTLYAENGSFIFAEDLLKSVRAFRNTEKNNTFKRLLYMVLLVKLIEFKSVNVIYEQKFKNIVMGGISL
jgi:hypothetical protein